MDTSRTFRQQFLLVFSFFITILSCDRNNNGDDIHDLVLHNDNGIQDSFSNNMFDSGTFYVEHKKFEHARDCFLKADSASPNMPVILNAMGNIVARANDNSKAPVYFEKALYIDSDFIETYINYGCYLNGEKQYEKAKTMFYLGLSRNPKDDIDKRVLYFNLADSYYELNQKSVALSFIDSAKKGPESGDIYDEIIDLERRIKSE